MSDYPKFEIDMPKKAKGTDKYSLLRECGLEPFAWNGCTNPQGKTLYTVNADQVLKLLKSAPLVYGMNHDPEDTNYNGDDDSEWLWSSSNDDTRDDHTHTARLVCIQEIKRDTAEGLLRELVHSAGKYYLTTGGTSLIDDLVNRARKLLGGEK